MRGLVLTVVTALLANLILTSNAALSSSLIFDDEFSGTSLDTTQWVTLNRGGDASNSEAECYLASNTSVGGGFLSLVSRSDQAGCASIGTSDQYSSSMVQWRNFNFLYGTVEARIKFAGGQGTWP